MKVITLNTAISNLAYYKAFYNVLSESIQLLLDKRKDKSSKHIAIQIFNRNKRAFLRFFNLYWNGAMIGKDTVLRFDVNLDGEMFFILSNDNSITSTQLIENYKSMDIKLSKPVSSVVDG